MAIEYVDDPEYFEYLDGQVHPKVSPRRKHGMVQFNAATVLRSAGGAFGDVAVEWRIRLVRGDAHRTEFQPDVSFMTHERLRALSEREREITPVAPDVAVEVRSPGDNLAYLRSKIDWYLRYGSILVFDVDIENRCLMAYDRDGNVTIFEESKRFSHVLVPWLIFDVAQLFVGLDLA